MAPAPFDLVMKIEEDGSNGHWYFVLWRTNHLGKSEVLMRSTSGYDNKRDCRLAALRATHFIERESHSLRDSLMPEQP